MDQGYAVLLYDGKNGPDIGFLTQDEALHLVIRLGKAHQWGAI